MLSKLLKCDDVTYSGLEYKMQEEAIHLKELIGSAEEIIIGKEDSINSIMRFAETIGGAKELRRLLRAHRFISAEQDKEFGDEIHTLETKLQWMINGALFVREEGEMRKQHRRSAENAGDPH